MKRRTHFNWLGAIGLIAVSMAGWLAVRQPAGDQKPALDLSRTGSFATNPGYGKLNLPQSADRVSASVAIAGSGRGQAGKMIRLALSIENGWHVNANPASLPFLIPTSVTASSDGKTIPLQVRYPPGRDSGIVLDGKNIKVFDDSATIFVQSLPGQTQLLSPDKPVDLALTVQSCSEKGVCLPPSTLNYSLTPTSQALK